MSPLRHSYSTRTPLAGGQDSATISKIERESKPSLRPFVKSHLVDLLLVTVMVAADFLLQFYLAWQDPVLRAVDPWRWTAIVQNYLTSPLEHIFSITPVLSGAPYYPKAFPALATLISTILGISAYDTIRFFPVISALNLVPMYFLSLYVSKSRRVATVSLVFVSISKFYSIRTSIANPECFTHFWLAFSLLFLIRLYYKSTWRNVALSTFFITMTLMFWHLPIAIFTVFLVVLAVVHLRHRRYLRKLMAVLVLSGLCAGLLWYLWAQPLELIRAINFPGLIGEISRQGLAGETSLPNLIGEGLFVQSGAIQVFSVVDAQSLAYYYYLSVVSWGWALPVLGICGLVCILMRRESRHDPGKMFLVVYFAAILLLILLCLKLRYDIFIFYYFFSALALPLSILGAMALIGIVDALARSNMMPRLGISRLMAFRLSPGHIRKPALALSLIAVMVFVMVSSNTANYGGARTYAWPFDVAFKTDSTILLFRYAKSIDAPSNDVYNALRWVRDHSSQKSYVVAFLGTPPNRESWGAVIREAFPDISERGFIDGRAFAGSLMQSLIDFRDDVLRVSGRDAYVVIGVYSWLQEYWANRTLEAQFLSYAAQRPDIFPEVYAVDGVSVFHVAEIHSVLASEINGDRSPQLDVTNTGGFLLQLELAEHFGHSSVHVECY